MNIYFHKRLMCFLSVFSILNNLLFRKIAYIYIKKHAFRETKGNQRLLVTGSLLVGRYGHNLNIPALPSCFLLGLEVAH